MAKQNSKSEMLIDTQLAHITDMIIDNSSEKFEGTNMDNEEIKNLSKTISLLKNSFDIEVLDTKTKSSLKKSVKNEYLDMVEDSNSSWANKLFMLPYSKQYMSAGLAIAAIFLFTFVFTNITNSGENLPAAASQYSGYLPLIILIIIGTITYFWKNKS